MQCRIYKLLIIFLGISLPCSVHAQNWDINILKSINPNPPSSFFWKQASSSAFYGTGAAAAGQLVYGIINDDQQVRQYSFELFISIGASTLFSEGLKTATQMKYLSIRRCTDIPFHRVMPLLLSIQQLQSPWIIKNGM